MTDPAWLTRLEKATDAEGHHMSGFAANEIAKEFREQQAEIKRLRAKVKRRDDKVADLLRDIKLWHGIKADRDERITERDEAREVARRFYEDIYDPTGSEVKRYPWLEEK